MQKILEFLSGKKSYIIAFLFAIWNFGVETQLWTVDNQIWSIVNYILGALGFAFLRAGVKKAGNGA
jgi:hypothetical protein